MTANQLYLERPVRGRDVPLDDEIGLGRWRETGIDSLLQCRAAYCDHAVLRDLYDRCLLGRRFHHHFSGWCNGRAKRRITNRHHVRRGVVHDASWLHTDVVMRR